MRTRQHFPLRCWWTLIVLIFKDIKNTEQWSTHTDTRERNHNHTTTLSSLCTSEGKRTNMHRAHVVLHTWACTHAYDMRTGTHRALLTHTEGEVLLRTPPRPPLTLTALQTQFVEMWKRLWFGIRSAVMWHRRWRHFQGKRWSSQKVGALKLRESIVTWFNVHKYQLCSLDVTLNLKWKPGVHLLARHLCVWAQRCHAQV